MATFFQFFAAGKKTLGKGPQLGVNLNLIRFNRFLVHRWLSQQASIAQLVTTRFQRLYPRRREILTTY